MAVAGRITGKDIVVTFGGTALTGDITSVAVDETSSTAQAAGAAETHEYEIGIRRNTSIDMEFFYDGATTTVWNCLLPLTQGTLLVYPKGTTATYPKWTWSSAMEIGRAHV
jgi:hypothetical protein